MWWSLTTCPSCCAEYSHGNRSFIPRCLNRQQTGRLSTKQKLYVCYRQLITHFSSRAARNENKVRLRRVLVIQWMRLSVVQGAGAVFRARASAKPVTVRACTSMYCRGRVPLAPVVLDRLGRVCRWPALCHSRVQSAARTVESTKVIALGLLSRSPCATSALDSSSKGARNLGSTSWLRE